MKILLVYPKYPDTSWSLNSMFNLSSNKNTFVPKDLLLISVLLPITWERKLVDLNKEKLSKKDILWADYIFIHANEKQYKSAVKSIDTFTLLNKKVVACGSLFTEYVEEFENVDYLVLDNIRATLPQFINDLENEKPQKVYHSNPFFEIRKAVESYYSLATISGKFSENIQFA